MHVICFNANIFVFWWKKDVVKRASVQCKKNPKVGSSLQVTTVHTTTDCFQLLELTNVFLLFVRTKTGVPRTPDKLGRQIRDGFIKPYDDFSGLFVFLGRAVESGETCVRVSPAVVVAADVLGTNLENGRPRHKNAPRSWSLLWRSHVSLLDLIHFHTCPIGQAGLLDLSHLYTCVCPSEIKFREKVLQTWRCHC